MLGFSEHDPELRMSHVEFCVLFRVYNKLKQGIVKNQKRIIWTQSVFWWFRS